MIRSTALRLALTLATIGLGCSMAESTSTGSVASADSTAESLPDRDSALAHRLVEQEGAILLDVRTRQEFADGHIPGAINIPHTEIGARMDEIVAVAGTQDDTAIVVYCRTGRRAGLAKELLLRRGPWPVTNLGGMSDW